METAEQLVQHDRVVCTYQLTRSVKMQLVKSPTAIAKTTTVITLIPQAVVAASLALLLCSLVLTTVPQQTLRFLAMMCSVAGWGFIALAIVSKSRMTALYYVLSGLAVFSAGIAGLHISVSFLVAGMLLNAMLPLFPVMLSRDNRLLNPGVVTGWSVFYLVMTLCLLNFVLA